VGLLLNLITLPVSGPVGATAWIAEQMQAVAEREYYDEAAIRQELLELEQRFDAGDLTEDEYEEAADELVERLLMAGELQAVRDDVDEHPLDEELRDE
jgi:Gas vesicle protein G